MIPASFAPPEPHEFAPYYGRYISLVPPGDFLSFVKAQADEFPNFLADIGEDRAGRSYAPGKWTIKEILGHLTDTERVFFYRALSIARGDVAPLPGFDQDLWNPQARFDERSLDSLLEEWIAVRRASLAFLNGLPAGCDLRLGQASDQRMSVRALVHVPPGHTVYHLQVIRERYLHL